MNITPKMADEHRAWEKAMDIEHNRPYREEYALNLGLDLQAARWDEHHQGFAFAPNGATLDGQHRLGAIALSGISVEMVCMFNCPPEYQRSMDDHRHRSVRDVAMVMMGDSRIENLHAAIASRMRFGSTHVQTRGVRRQETLGYMMKHFEPIEFTLRATKGKKLSGITRAAVLAPVARAWLEYDRGRLEAFVNVLLTGQTEDPRKDYIAVQLRDYLIRSVSKKHRPVDELIYAKTERALMAFLKGEQTLKLYEAKTELFPIPSDTARGPIKSATLSGAQKLRRVIERGRELRAQQEESDGNQA